MPNCVCQPSVMAETTVNHSAFAFIVFDFQHWVAKLRLRRRYFQHSKHNVTTPRAGITSDYGRLAEKLALNRFPGPFLVCDLNRTPIVMAKHGDPCVHFFRNLLLRENLARDCFTSTAASTVTNYVQNSFTCQRYCDK